MEPKFKSNMKNWGPLKAGGSSGKGLWCERVGSSGYTQNSLVHAHLQEKQTCLRDRKQSCKLK
jgi:hypothetical protein